MPPFGAQKVAYCTLKGGLSEGEIRHVGNRLARSQAAVDVLMNVKLSFFDKYLLKKFGTFEFCPYLCISINDK
jgi:hypothetical protein